MIPSPAKAILTGRKVGTPVIVASVPNKQASALKKSSHALSSMTELRQRVTTISAVSSTSWKGVSSSSDPVAAKFPVPSVVGGRTGRRAQ